MSKPLCVIQAPVFSRSGYGDFSKEIAKSIIRYDKFDVKIAATKWGANVIKRHESELDDSDPLNKVLFEKTLKEPLNRQPDVFIQVSIPNEFKPIGKYNIGVTAGIETTAAAGDWIEGLNRMNMNVVTSKHSKKVFVDADYTREYKDGSGRKEPLRNEKPIEVCFWGANTNIYKTSSEKVESVEEVMSQIPETFAFLFVGQWTSDNPFTDRKDIGNLIKTFLETFKDRAQKPCLILKTNGVNFSKIDRDKTIKKIKIVESQVKGDLPKVYLIHGELSDSEMNALYNHEKVKCHISFTHGEGFGHPLLLASLSGKPVLASNWSGHLDFLDSNPSNLLRGKVETINPAAVNQWLIKESGWFNVAYSLASDKMKEMYFGMSKSVKEKALELADKNSKEFSIHAMDNVLHGILDKYVPDFAVEEKIVIPQLKHLTIPSSEFINQFKVYDLGVDKIRVGRDQDGGYIFANKDLEKIDTVYSFGVDCEMGMESHFHEINPTAKINMYDPAGKLYSQNYNKVKMEKFVAELPSYCKFTNIGVCGDRVTNEHLKPLSKLITENQDDKKRLLLKMDIEGGEFDVFMNTNINHLLLFDQLSVEFHFNLNDNSLFQTYSNVLKKLNEHFYMFHVHANNYAPVITVNGHAIPSVLEISFAKKSLFPNAVPSPVANKGTEYLDFPNNPNAPEIKLDAFPFVRPV